MSTSGDERETSEEALSPPDAPDSAASARQRRMWSKQEDERLRLLVSYWGDQGGRRSNWDKIAANFEERSSKDCRKRWFHSLDPKLRRGKWSKSEDKVLKEAFQRLGPAWQRIAQLIPGRTDDQCAKRYNDVLDPSVQDRLRTWDDAEDEKLLGMYAKHGAKWQTIARELDGRTGLTCRNRWRKLTRPSRAPRGGSRDDASSGDAAATPAAPEQPESQAAMLASGLQFDVPGSSQVAGFPAGAEPNWLFGGGGGPGGPLGSHRNLTLTIEDPAEPPEQVLQPVHHTISEIHLDRILQHAAEHKQQIVIHQHIYQSAVAPAPALPRQPDATLMRAMAAPPPPPGDPGQAAAAHMAAQLGARPPPHQTHHAHHAHQVHQAQQAQQAQQTQQAPPDEFLSRPLMFDDAAVMPRPLSSVFDPDAIDFLAFNPS